MLINSTAKKAKKKSYLKGKYWTISIDESRVDPRCKVLYSKFAILIHDDITEVANHISKFTPKEIVEIIESVDQEKRKINVCCLKKNIRISYLAMGGEKHFFEIIIELKNGRTTEFLIATERLKKHDNWAYCPEVDYSARRKKEIAYFKKMKGKHVPLIGKEGSMTDGRVWYVVEYVRGKPLSSLKKEEFTVEVVGTIIDVAYGLLGKLGGKIPLDMISYDNIILRDKSEEIVFHDLGGPLYDLDNEETGSQERIFTLIQLVGGYGFTIDTVAIVFDGFLKILGRKKGLRFFDEIYQNMSKLGAKGAFALYKKIYTQVLGSAAAAKINKELGEKEAKKTCQSLEKYLKSQISSFKPGILVKTEDLKFTKMFSKPS